MGRSADFLHNRAGSAAVEFALVGPLFVYLLIGLTVYGGWLWMAQGVQPLAAEGARAAVAGLNADEQERLAREAIAQSVSSASALDPEAVEVEVEGSAAEIDVRVRYDANRHPLMALAGLVPSPPPTIERTASVRAGGQ